MEEPDKHYKMDFHSVMETFAEAWVAANTHTPLTVAAEQGLINGPTNHHSNSSPPLHVQQVTSNIQNHQLQIPINGHNDSETSSTHLFELNSVHVHPNLCSPQENSNELQEQDLSSEGEIGKVSERSSDDLTRTCSSLTEMRPCINSPKPLGKSLPVHCIVEQVPGPQACGQHVELDSYAIVPSDTLFKDLVRTALGKLGYLTSQILCAKGSIQIKRWKALAFDQITENPEATVADILGELTTVATLHMRLYSVPDDPKEWKDTTVRNAVLELLREMSQIKLAKLCPLSQPMLSNIINNRYLGKIGNEKCTEFGFWYLDYRKQNPEGKVLEVVPSDRPADGRLTFHPTKELPVMREWFQSCRSPSRRTLQLYVDILNQGPVRQQERPKVTITTLKNWWKNEKQRERKHLRDEDKADDPVKTRKKKKRSDAGSSKSLLQENSQDHEPAQSRDVSSKLKSNNFTLINHIEYESDTEKSDKKDSDANDSVNITTRSSLSFPKVNIPEVSQSNSLTMINYSDAGSEEANSLLKDFSSSENGSLLHSPKTSSESSIFHKIHRVCGEDNHALFPFSDPPLSLNSCNKIYDDNALNRTKSKDENSLGSEDNVDVVQD